MNDMPDAPIPLAALDGDGTTDRLCTLLAERNGTLRAEVDALTKRCRLQAVVIDIARDVYPQLRVRAASRMRDALDAVTAHELEMLG
jgi:hypothetical protein